MILAHASADKAVAKAMPPSEPLLAKAAGSITKEAGRAPKACDLRECDCAMFSILRASPEKGKK
jgi:hypothetical protein